MKYTLKLLINVVIIIVTSVAAAVFMYNSLEKERTFVPSKAGLDPVVEKSLERIRLQNALIDGFHRKKELIALEVELSEVVTWDESWGKLGFFRKSQRMRFYGTGIYVCDLSQISSEDIGVDSISDKITVSIPKPVIKSITIDETKTEYEDIDKGMLRLGAIKLTQKQYASVYNLVKQSMRRSMDTEEIAEKARESAEASVKEIFEEFLYSIGEGYTITAVCIGGK